MSADARTPYGARRYHERQECPKCGRTIATLVPWHGDGSLVRFVAHGIGGRCPGSGQVPPGYEPFASAREGAS